MFGLHIILIVTLWLMGRAGAANILAAFPIPAKSHWGAMRPLLIELARRGHNLTVITPFEEKEVPNTWETVLIDKHWKMPGHSHTGVFESRTTPNIFLFMFVVYNIGINLCENVLKEEKIQNLINTQEKKFDLLIMELFIDECLLAFAHKFDIPIVGMPSSGGFIWTSDSVGNPSPLSYVPEGLSEFTDHMTFFERLRNTISATHMRLSRQFYFVPKIDSLVRKYFKDPKIPSIADIERNTSLILANTHVSFGYPKPNVPNRVEVGGMHIFPPQKLPEDLQKYLDKCTKGVIYFSMGSNLRSSALPANKREIFLNVFATLKECVLWKWETDDLPGKPANVKIEKWLPQTDLLAHRNIKLFISHGGLMSTIEAISRGVPILGIPIMADQHINIRMVDSGGYGIKLEFQNITEDSLKWAISELLHNTRYKETISQRQRIFQDRKMKPLDEAVYWTEYIIRHRGAYHLRSAVLDLTWYQYMLLDVLCFVLVLSITVLLTTVYLIKTLMTKVTTQNKTDRLLKSNREKVD